MFITSKIGKKKIVKDLDIFDVPHMKTLEELLVLEIEISHFYWLVRWFVIL